MKNLTESELENYNYMEDTVCILGILNGDLLEKSQHDNCYSGFQEKLFSQKKKKKQQK